MILIYPPGTFPNGAAWGCFFINLYYLWLGVIFFLFLYYVGDPLFQWLRRSYQAYFALVQSFRLRIAARRAIMEQFDEALLTNIEQTYATADKKRRRVKEGQGGARIGAEMASEVAIPISGSRTSLLQRLGAPMNIDHTQLIEFTRMEMENDEKRLLIAQKMDALAAKIGAQVTEDTGHPRQERKSHRIWDAVTSFMQMPFQTTPVFQNHLRIFHDHMREHAPPPGAAEFISPHETFVHQNMK